MRLAIAFLMLLAAGCATVKPGADDAAAVNEIVSMAVETLRSSREVQRERLGGALNTLASQPNDANRLRAAVLLSTLPAPLRDGPRASSLLLVLADRKPATPMSDFAALFQARMLEREEEIGELRQRLNAAEKQAMLLRAEVDSLRASERMLAEREEALRRRGAVLQRGVAEREELVRRQVEALRESERTMAEREETIRKQVEALRESERIMSEREGRLGTKTR
jgi:hypothetical protein